MSKKEDRRIRKSKKHIKQSFVALIQEKGLGEMSVYDITEKADINRGTFYLHYQDKYDLFEKYVDELLDELISVIQPSEQEKENIIQGEGDQEGKKRHQALFIHLQNHASFYYSMFNYKGGPYFYDRFLNELRAYFCKEIKELNIAKKHRQFDQDVLIYFITYAFFGVVNYWIENRMSESPEVMGEQLDHLLRSLF